jgi:integrase
VSHVEDRWFKVTEGPDGKRTRAQTARHGKGLRYRARVITPDGRERNKSFRTKTEAEAFSTTTAADVHRGHYTDPDAGKVTLRAFAGSWLGMQGDWQASTLEAVETRLRKHIYPKLGGYTLAQLAQRPSIVQGWLGGLDMSPAYKRTVLTTLSTIMVAAVTDGLVIRNPCREKTVKRPKATQSRVEPWPDEHIPAVRAALPEPWRALVDLGAGLGLRQGEIFGLAATDIEWLRKGGPVVHVRRQVRIVRGRLVFALPKGGKERQVPLPEPVALALSEHLRTRPARAVTLPWLEPSGKPVTAELLLTSATGLALNRNTFNVHVWKPALRAAGLDSANRENGTHALRHYFASSLLHHGCDIKSVSEYLGHHSAAFTLAVYAHVMPTAHDRMREAIDAIYWDQDHGPTASQGGAK